MARHDLDHVVFPLWTYAGGGLKSVTLEPIGSALDVQRAAGQVAAFDGSV